MDRVAAPSAGQGTAPPQALPQGRGWAVLHTDAGIVLRLLAGGGDVRLTADQVRALRQGDVTAATLLEQAGLPAAPLQAIPQPPQAPVYGTQVILSPEARRRAGAADTAAAADGASAQGRQGRAGPTLPRTAWIVLGATALLLAVFLGRA